MQALASPASARGVVYRKCLTLQCDNMQFAVLTTVSMLQQLCLSCRIASCFLALLLRLHSADLLYQHELLTELGVREVA